MFPQRYGTFEQLRDDRLQCSMLLWMDVVYIWRSESHRTIFCDGKVQRKPLEVLRDIVFATARRSQRPVFAGPWAFGECAIVNDGIEVGVDETQDLVVGPRLPVFLCIWDVLKRRNRGDQLVSEVTRDQRVGLPDPLIGSDLTIRCSLKGYTGQERGLTSIPVSGSRMDAYPCSSWNT